MSKELKPPRKMRRIQPRCCATCKHITFADEDGEAMGHWLCKRDPDFKVLKNIPVDAGDMFQWQYVCDRWVKQS